MTKLTDPIVKGLAIGCLAVFLCLPTARAQLHDVTDAEYFWDTDPGKGNGTPLTVIQNDTVTIDQTINTTGLSAGVHSLGVRLKREDGVWGDATIRNVRIGTTNPFDAAEVYWDTDPGEGGGTPVAITAQGVVNEVAFDVPNIPKGFHKFNLRVRSGIWSQVTSRTVRVGSSFIDGAEVYFDTDPGEGNATPVDVPIAGPNVVAFDTTVAVTASSQGTHKLYLRFRGGDVWSFPRSTTMRIGLPVSGSVNYIAGGEFFWDSDPGEGNGCAFIADDGEFDDGDEYMHRYFMDESFSLGQHIVYARIQDAGGRWFGTVRDTVQIVEAHTLISAYIDTVGNKVRVSWTPFPEATQYKVYYDSLITGPFTNFISVAPPDTHITITPTQLVQFYKVAAVQPDAQPCDAVAASGENSKLSIPNSNTEREEIDEAIMQLEK